MLIIQDRTPIYMGNTIFIQDRRVCVKPLYSQLEAIQKIRPPTTAKQCKSFVGMVNFVSIFCLELCARAQSWVAH